MFCAHIENRLVPCLNFGCEKMVPAKDLLNHSTTTCEKAKLRMFMAHESEKRNWIQACPFRCGAEMRQKDEKKHITQECPQRLVRCPWDG